MRKPYSAITAEGYPVILGSGFAALVFGVLDWWPPALLFLLFSAFAGHFFRDPERVIPGKAGLAVSPADGKIIRIAQMSDPFSGRPQQCISIFMNVFDVHVNRAPVSAAIRAIEYKSGRFINASLNKASEDNERCLYSLTDEDGLSWTVVQIAGLIARRIVCRVDEGEKIKRGERFGMIKFGSRVDVYLPDGWTPKVMLGDVVLAGHSVLAHKAEQAAAAPVMETELPAKKSSRRPAAGKDAGAAAAS
ncbi:MAG: phosphatidylserine decarboxylase family protein [Deltaproteobacteria bacterium]|jgi:phosphatidylserine decarboxylase|nr:phosphatidylserine decarboxylase family protein [Deltaproteobacteria bacterium]